MKIPQEVILKINSLKAPAIVAVSGFGGAGKSTFAKLLGETINTPVVGIDSFQKDGAFDTDYSLWEIMDFARLESEVLVPFTNGQKVISYGHFDPRHRSISESKEIVNSGLVIIEGVGLFNPSLIKYFGLKIWLNTPMDIAIARGKKRDREEYQSPTDKLWDTIWKKNDEEYYKQYKPHEIADFIVSNSNS